MGRGGGESRENHVLPVMLLHVFAAVCALGSPRVSPFSLTPFRRLRGGLGQAVSALRLLNVLGCYSFSLEKPALGNPSNSILLAASAMAASSQAQQVPATERWAIDCAAAVEHWVGSDQDTLEGVLRARLHTEELQDLVQVARKALVPLGLGPDGP